MVIKESISLAKEEPYIFLPKLIYILISSFWIIGFLSRVGNIYFYLFTMPILVYLSFFSSVMIASIAKESGKSLKHHFSQVYNLKKYLLYLVLTLFSISMVAGIPAVLGVILIQLYGLYYIGVILVILGGLLSLGAAFYFYFVPISFIENKKTKAVLKDSFSMSSNNSSEVLLLFGISIGLLVGAQLSEGVFRSIGHIGFVVARVLESIVSTYIFILGSKYYLENN